MGETNMDGISLAFTARDPEVVEFLRPHDAAEQEEKAKAALRIGVLAMKSAQGVVDAEAIRREGDRLVDDMRTELARHATRVSQDTALTLARYLDPSTGAFQQGVERLEQREKALVSAMEESLVRQFGDSGAMARTLAKGVGAESPLFQMLDPARREGLLARMEGVIATALEGQRAAVLREFSLDDAGSALSRLVREVSGHNERLTQQLSLDQPDSALSRLVERVDQAQRLTVEQFSLDSDASALSRMLRTLKQSIGDLGENQQAFQGQVLEVLVRFAERKSADAGGTRHGHAFEFALLNKVEEMAEGAGDLFEATGNTTGLIRNCKKGDAVVTVGPQKFGAGRKLVYEAKEDAGYNDPKAVAEIDEAMKNRSADVGVFVFSSKVVDPQMKRLRRLGAAFLVVWDQDDPATDIVLEAVHAAATSLLAQKSVDADAEQFDFSKIDTELAEVEKQAARMATIRSKAESIRSAAAAIDEEARVVGDKIGASVLRLRTQVASLKERG